MNQQQIHQYIHRFFKENQCEVVEGNDDQLTVKLTIGMDKRIMNRPYYWSYVESGGVEAKPAQLTFFTNPELFSSAAQGERIHFGSPRLHQLFDVTKEQGAFVQLYERPAPNQTTQTTLTPWLAMNIKVTYSSDRTKESLYSLGMNLMTGAVIDGFQESMRKLDLDASMSPNTYYLPYIIHPKKGIERLESLMDRVIEQDDHAWMEEAKQRLVRDTRVLNYFYQDVDQLPESYAVEKSAIDAQYKTMIQVEVLNGGLFYLRTVLI